MPTIRSTLSKNKDIIGTLLKIGTFDDKTHFKTSRKAIEIIIKIPFIDLSENMLDKYLLSKVLICLSNYFLSCDRDEDLKKMAMEAVILMTNYL